MSEYDWSKITAKQARVLLDLFQGKREMCWNCTDLALKETCTSIGALEDGRPRYLCAECASQERNYARTPEEECGQCGVLRKQIDSLLCRPCQVKLSEAEHAEN